LAWDLPKGDTIPEESNRGWDLTPARSRPGIIPGPVERDLHYLFDRRVERRDVMMEMVKSFWNDESGQGLVEYAVLLGLLTVAVIVTIGLIGGHIARIFESVEALLAPAAPAG
jgi:pilus assembly protein Flp/PilA